MDTAEKDNRKYHYIILIPHRDIQREVEKYRQKLFSLGFYGSYSFPICAPLALISRPSGGEELKELAKNIRQLSLENNGKIIIGSNLQYKSGMICFDDELSFFGPALSINIDKIPFAKKDKILSVFSVPLICTSLVKTEVKNTESLPALSFRAASLANLSIQAMHGAELSFEWEISDKIWLSPLKA